MSRGLLAEPPEPDEIRIEKMLKRGTDILSAAINEYKPLAVFAAFSGGNDSIVSTHFACANFGAGVVHCNTQIGIEKTREHVRWITKKFRWDLREQVCPNEGKPDKLNVRDLPGGVWIDGNTAYETYVLNFGFAGPAQHGRMYQRLKERSLSIVLADTKRGHSRTDCIILVSGIRQDESAIRAGYRRAVQKDNSMIWVNPFYWNSAADFELYRQEFGLPRNPVSLKIGISGECLCGAFAQPGELKLIRSVEPKTADYITDLQKRVRDNGFPWDWGNRPPKWWTDRNKNLVGLLDLRLPEFQPMCVGCPRRRGA